MKIIIALLGTLLLVTPAMSQPAADAGDPRIAAFDAELQRLKREHHLPGLAVAVVEDRALLWAEGYGTSDANHQIPVTPDTPFWIASVTKTFVGLAFLQLEAEGRIDLSDRAADTPDFTDLCTWLSGSGLPMGRGLDCAAPITIDNVLTHQVQGVPGTEFSYNPIVFSRLSRYLEYEMTGDIAGVKTGQNALAQAITRTILEPAGMDRTMASLWDRSRPMVFFDMAEGFGVEEGQFVQRPRPGRYIAGGAGVVSTVQDLARYDIAIDTGVIATPQIRDRLFGPARFTDGSPSPYGYGWYSQSLGGETVQWHGGWDPDRGFSALYLRLPERGLSVVLLANGEGIWWDNPLDEARVQDAPFAQAFLRAFAPDLAAPVAD